MLPYRLQSAMEYLMTYGWAILIIAVVLGALYQLGLFGSFAGATQSGCVATPGFLCSSPVMNTTGVLGIQFGQIGPGSITITGTACGLNSTFPSSSQPVNLQLASSATTALGFNCPTSASSLGTSFKGYLWVIYTNSAGQSGIIQKVGIVTAKISTSGNIVASGGGPAYIYCVGSNYASPYNQVYYAPITSSGVGTWKSSTSYPEGIYNGGCSIYQSEIYCVGGSGGSGDEYYAPVSSNGIGTWSSTTSYPDSIVNGGCSINGGYIYCVGGVGRSPYNQAYYAQVSGGGIGAWTSTTNYPMAFHHAGCSIYGGYIYCVGGNGASPFNQVYYATVSSTGIGAWSATTSYPVAMQTAGCSIYSGYIYCVGTAGTGTSEEVYYASVSSGGVGTWTSTTSYPVAMQAAGCSIYNGYIYCVGTVGTASSTQVYYASVSSTGVGTWISTTSYPIGIYGSYCEIPGSGGGFLGGGGPD